MINVTLVPYEKGIPLGSYNVNTSLINFFEVVTDGNEIMFFKEADSGEHIIFNVSKVLIKVEELE